MSQRLGRVFWQQIGSGLQQPSCTKSIRNEIVSRWVKSASERIEKDFLRKQQTSFMFTQTNIALRIACPILAITECFSNHRVESEGFIEPEIRVSRVELEKSPQTQMTSRRSTYTCLIGTTTGARDLPLSNRLSIGFSH
jgi:hypothetical protein